MIVDIVVHVSKSKVLLDEIYTCPFFLKAFMKLQIAPVQENQYSSQLLHHSLGNEKYLNRSF